MTQNNDDIFSLRNLAIERDEARENLKDNFSETKERVRPSNLIQEAKSKALDQVQKTGKGAVATVKENPAITASVIAAAALVALRKPISQFMSNRAKSPDTEHSEE